MLRKISFYIIIYPLAVLLFGFYFWGEARSISSVAPGSGEAAPLPAGVPAPVYDRSERILLEGSSLETTYTLVTTPVEGPVVLVIGGIHGDEPASYLAAGEIASWVVDRGTLIVIPRANTAAIRRQHRLGADLLDLNRTFPGRHDGGPTEQLAAAIYAVMLEHQPDWVIDLHEALYFERIQPGALGQTIIYPPGATSSLFVEELLKAVNLTIESPANHFLPRRGLLNGTALRAAVSAGAEGVIVETCRQLPLEIRVDYQRQAVLSLLYLLGVTVY